MRYLFNPSRWLTAIFICLVITGCSDDRSDQVQMSEPSYPEHSAGSLVLSTTEQTVTGNVQLTINAQDDNGIARVYLSFSGTDDVLTVCDGECSGRSIQQFLGNINPTEYGLEPGTITITLWVEDSIGSESSVATISINWEKLTIENVQVTRSADGTGALVSWTQNTQLTRYNVYWASESGVNQSNYLSLNNGDALLALTDASAELSGLLATTMYFVLVTGVDSSGETAFAEEVSIAPGATTNQPPEAVDDTATTPEDTPIDLSPLVNDSDPDGDTISLIDATSANGSLMIAGDTLTFTPLTNFNGDATIDYIIADTAGGTSTAQITVVVSPVNDAPIAAGDTASTLVDTSVSIQVLANDSDPDGDPLTVTSATADNGSVTIVAGTSIEYTPDAGYFGSDIITYEIADPSGETASAFVTVTVDTTGAMITALDDDYHMFGDSTLTESTSSGVLANDSSSNGQSLTVNTTPVTNTSNGVLTLNSDGSFTYTPTAGFTGTDMFVYEASLPDGTSAQAEVIIYIYAPRGDVTGESLSATGNLYYIGEGDITAGGGYGSGLYRVGDCIQIIDTECTIYGSYLEDNSSSFLPGEMGEYVFSMRYSGTGNSPVLAQSSTPGGNSVYFVDVGDALFTLTLFSPYGDIVEGTFPDQDNSTLSNFSIFILPQEVCTGLPTTATCNIGNVGLNQGSDLTAPIDNVVFTMSGYALNNVSYDPVATDDAYSVEPETTLTVTADTGVLQNDFDPDQTIVGDALEDIIPIQGASGQPVALAVDEYRQKVYVYSSFSNEIEVLNRAGESLGVVSWPGIGANDADLDVAGSALYLAYTNVPAGSLLAFDGEDGATEIYAIDPVNDSVVSYLETDFGSSHVVGGTYNPTTGTFFLLQDNVPGGTDGNKVAEINAGTGAILNEFLLADTSMPFDVSFGDIDTNAETGTLYLVSSNQSSIAEYTTAGEFIRYIVLPNAVSSPSGLSISSKGERLWAVNNTTDSAVYEMKFVNDGTLPGLISRVVTPPQNGTLTLNLDGSFTYVPNTGFSGQDSFTYEVDDQTNNTDQASVVIDVAVDTTKHDDKR